MFQLAKTHLFIFSYVSHFLFRPSIIYHTVEISGVDKAPANPAAQGVPKQNTKLC